MKSFIALAFCLLFFFKNGISQLVEDENKILNQLIVHFSKSSKGEIQHLFPAYKIKECLSQRMNLWLVEKSNGTISENEFIFWKENALVQSVQFNHRVQKRSIVPNDPFFPYQWNMLNTGQNSGTIGSDIDATFAWQINHSNITKTGDTIVIAVIEDQVDIFHEDLNYFVNYNEIPANGKDDDGNGFIDDYWGWNVYDNNDSVYGNASHGSHVAGIAGAKGDNNKGVAGICWGVKILAIDGSSELESDVVKAYDYALAMRALYNSSGGTKGAFVVATNSSFGVGNYGANPIDYPIWCALYDSLGKYGILSAVAAPNATVNIDVVHDVPTQCPSRFKIGVTNSDRNDAKNSQCGYGLNSVDLGAPGTFIYSTYPNNSYAYSTGTSMSTPHVTGTIAAMYATACSNLISDYKTYPDSLALIMKDYILKGTDKIASMKHLTASDGRLNLYKSFLEVENYNCNRCTYSATIATKDISCKGGNDGNALLSLSGSLIDYAIHWSNDTLNSSSISNLSAGNYVVTVTENGGCIRTLNFFINEPPAIKITTISITPISGGTGNIIVNAKAGNDSLQYAIDNGTYQSNGIFSINTAGSKTIHIKNESGCVKDTILSIYHTDIEGLTVVSSFQVFPNPATEKLNLQIKSIESRELEVVVSDLLGRKIYTKTVFVSPSFTNEIVDVADFPKGFYCIYLVSENRILKNKTYCVAIKIGSISTSLLI